MKEKELKKHIYNAVAAQTPDLYEKVSSVPVVKKKDEVIIKNRKFNTGYVLSAAVAACLCLFIIGMHQKEIKIISTVDIDVNPSLEIQINDKDQVIKVIPMNEEAKQVIGEMDFRKVDIDIVSNAIFGSMVKLGYINETNNAILVTVQSKKEGKAQELEEKFAKDINQILSENSLNATILNQKKETTADVEGIAEKYNISAGKALFIYHMVEKDSSLKIEELADLSIGELTALIGTSSTMTLEELVTDESEYIGVEMAKKIALEETGGGTVREAELEYEANQTVYEIEIINEGIEYKINIHAGSGRILSNEKEEIEREDLEEEKFEDRKEKTDKQVREKREKKADSDDREKISDSRNHDKLQEPKADKAENKNKGSNNGKAGYKGGDKEDVDDEEEDQDDDADGYKDEEEIDGGGEEINGGDEEGEDNGWDDEENDEEHSKEDDEDEVEED